MNDTFSSGLFGAKRTIKSIAQRLGLKPKRFEERVRRSMVGLREPHARAYVDYCKVAVELGLVSGSDTLVQFMDRLALDSGILPEWGCQSPLQGDRFVEMFRLLRLQPWLIIEVVDLLRNRLGVEAPPVLPDLGDRPVGASFGDRKPGKGRR